ncbi:MAG: hypothetical protein N2510_09630 [Ignavibacteria bacterium]|nr:hypothetical protein [Ignavibacteria bacterium]
MDEATRQFNQEIERVSGAAFQSARGGDDNWNKLLESYDIEPLDKDIKEALLNSEMKIARGAFPVELRKVYEKIIEKHSSTNSAELKNILSNFDMEGKIKAYYQKIKPFGGISDIFKNASVTITKYSQGMQKAKHHTMKCKSCGSPRLEEMQYDNCLFCGSKLFEPA